MAFGTLSIAYADGRRATFPLERTTTRIGRAADNDIVLADPAVLPYHLQILYGSQGCEVLNLGDSGTVLVNRAPLMNGASLSLAHGSSIEIGGSRLTMSLSGNRGRETPVNQSALTAQQQDLLGTLLSAPTVANLTSAAPTSTLTLPPPGPTEPLPATPPPRRPQIHLTADITALTVDAGGTVVISVAVANASQIVDRIEISIEGLEANWVKFAPPSHSLLPNARGETQVLISPPRTPASKAGVYPFEIVARSEQRPAERVAVQAELTVLPFNEFRFSMLDPKEQSGWILGNYNLEVANRGNQQQTYEFQGTNDENVFLFRTTPPAPIVRPGAITKVRLNTRLRLVRWFGKPKQHVFTVIATPSDETIAPQQVAGRFVQNPPLPPWLMLLLAALLLLSLLGCLCYLLLPFVQRFRAAGAATAQTTTALPTALQPTAPGLPTAPAVPTVDVAATTGALVAGQNATVAAQADAFSQTAAALGNANSVTQTAFALGFAQTQTAQTNTFAQTVTAGAVSVAQTQTAIALANDSTAFAQANLNATATAGAAGAQQAATDAAAAAQQAATTQANLNATATANALGIQQTLTALPNANAATLTAVAQNFIGTQTAQALFLTQTALALPPPTPTNTPTATPEADIVVRPDNVAATTLIHGDKYVGQGVIFCFYVSRGTIILRSTDGSTLGGTLDAGTTPAAVAESGAFISVPNGEPDCNPRQLPNVEQEQPYIYPPNQSTNGPSSAITAEFVSCQNYVCSNRLVQAPTAVINFPQRSVASATVGFWLPPDPDNATSGVTYTLQAFDGEGNLVATSNTGELSVPAFYSVTVRSSSARIQQIQLSLSGDRENNAMFITSITARYTP